MLNVVPLKLLEFFVEADYLVLTVFVDCFSPFM
jgi:hypothetical protein